MLLRLLHASFFCSAFLYDQLYAPSPRHASGAPPPTTSPHPRPAASCTSRQTAGAERGCGGGRGGRPVHGGHDAVEEDQVWQEAPRAHQLQGLPPAHALGHLVAPRPQRLPESPAPLRPLWQRAASHLSLSLLCPQLRRKTSGGRVGARPELGLPPSQQACSRPSRRLPSASQQCTRASARRGTHVLHDEVVQHVVIDLRRGQSRGCSGGRGPGKCSHSPVRGQRASGTLSRALGRIRRLRLTRNTPTMDRRHVRSKLQTFRGRPSDT